MAAVKLEQYLASVLDSKKSDTNEIRIKPGNEDFNLFSAFWKIGILGYIVIKLQA
ncbi:hypothetical protein SDC49_20630 [Lactobacillus sp. R2/2]|nr:hypothetical protein [Lactobacillus sp. R2/2]